MSRILMLLDNAFTSDLRVSKEAQSLIKSGHEVTLVCVTQEGLPAEEQLDGIEVRRWISPNFTRPFSRSWKSERSELINRLLAEEFEALHCHDYMMLDIGIRLREKRPYIPMFYDAHEYFRGLPFHTSLNGIFAKVKGWFVWKYFLKREQIGLRNANVVITTTPAIAELLSRRSRRKLTPIVVPNISTLTPTNDATHSLRSTLGIQEQDRILVQSGNLYQSVDFLEAMCDVVVRHSPWHFVILNDRPIAEKAKQLIKDHPTWKGRIHVLPYHADQLADQLSSADAGLMYVRSDRWKSHYLTSPNRLMEYQHLGLPVITVAQSEAERYAENGHILFFDHNDIESFEGQLLELDKNLATYQQQAMKMKDSLKWDTAFRPVLRLYEIIIENSSK